MLFKKGDIVIPHENAFWQYSKTNAKYLKQAKVLEVKGDLIKIGDFVWKEDVSSADYYYVDEKYFKLKPSGNSIHITWDGESDTVNGVMKEGDKVVKRTKAVCSKEDDFDFRCGAEIVLDRLIDRCESDISENSVKVGDTVVVTSPGKIYTSYVEWVNKYAPNYAVYWQYGNPLTVFKSYDSTNRYKVVGKGSHLRDDVMLLAIQDRGNRVFVIAEDGVKKVNDETCCHCDV